MQDLTLKLVRYEMRSVRRIVDLDGGCKEK